jgi:AbrB family looped-hinge helix DNA binding protein
MAEAKLSSKNQIVVPREAREALDLKPGDKLQFVLRDRGVVLVQKAGSHRAALAGIARGLYPKDYLKKERNSWR